MQHTVVITIDGVSYDIALEVPQDRWEEIIRLGSKAAAKNIGAALDKKRSDRGSLETDEATLRDIIQKVHGV